MDLSRRRLMIGGVALIAAPVIVRAASLMVIRGEPLIITPPPLELPLHYILKGKEIVQCKPGFDGLVQWAQFLGGAVRHVAETRLPDGSYVSTVFIGLDLGSPLRRRIIGEPCQPLLFETMVFHGPNDQSCDRYHTWDEAEAGHRAMVAREQRRLYHIAEKKES